MIDDDDDLDTVWPNSQHEILKIRGSSIVVDTVSSSSSRQCRR